VTTGACFAFGRFELDAGRRLLTYDGEPVAVSDRQLDVLLLLVARAGQIVPKDDLVQAGWKEVAVSDNSLEQVISSLRKLLLAHAADTSFIETLPRRGYRFGLTVERRAVRESDTGLDALLAPHRAFTEGRAALETLEAGQIARAREVFEGALRTAPDHASAHLGLASACILQYETTRVDPAPDVQARERALEHAREACRLDPRSAEAWATLGFVLDRAGTRVDALAAAKRAITLEPDNWRHHFRHALISWGEERLGAAHRTLALLPGFPLAHWLAATVHVARQVPGEAERELAAAIRSQGSLSTSESKFSPVALHWLLGLVRNSRGDETGALEAFNRELSFEASGHLYARECCANTLYAIGAIHLRQGRQSDATTAFEAAIARVPAHPLARVGLALTAGRDQLAAPSIVESGPIELIMARAACQLLTGQPDAAVRLLETALAAAPPGNTGWTLPVDPLLRLFDDGGAWATILARVRNRAA
jgi:DNA-binding winged helix-turn-helix (wHTH) protein